MVQRLLTRVDDDQWCKQNPIEGRGADDACAKCNEPFCICPRRRLWASSEACMEGLKIDHKQACPALLQEKPSNTWNISFKHVFGKGLPQLTRVFRLPHLITIVNYLLKVRVVLVLDWCKRHAVPTFLLCGTCTSGAHHSVTYVDLLSARASSSNFTVPRAAFRCAAPSHGIFL
jgi:hypothetical protein